MMATSVGPNFQGHPAGMNHPGVGGHPMGPGMPPNQGQGGPGGGMPPQFAGNPMAGGQVNPAMMGGMPPGANPNAHSMAHLTPAQQQMIQQQQQLQFNNPSAMAAMRQQQQIMQQQQRQAILQQQLAQGGMPNNMPMGIPLHQLTAQQIQQLRASGRLGPAQHPQAMLAQQIAMQQQQQAQNQQMQGSPHPGQHMQMNPQALQMQQQQSQMGGGPGQPGQQGPGQQGQPGQQPGQQQPGPQNQGTPQPSQAGTPGPTGPQTPVPAPTPGATGAPQAQTPQSQPQPQPQGQGPQPQQQPGQQQQPQPQQQGPQQGQPGQMGQPGQPGPQGQQQMQMTPQQQMAAHQMAMNNQIMQQQRRENMKSQCMLKLMQFSEHLSAYPGMQTRDDLSYWNAFVHLFFSPAGVFRHSLQITDSEELSTKQYDIAFPAIARYLHTYFGSGVKNMQLVLDKSVTDRPLPNDGYCIENPTATFIYWFETGSHLVATGSLRAQFDADAKLEVLEFITTSQEEYIPRKQVIDAAKPAHMWMKEWHKVNATENKSPELSKKGKGKQLKSPQSHPPEVLSDLPDSAVNSKGVTEAVHQFLEIVEVMGQMNPLFGFTHSNPGVGPYAALDQYVSVYINGAGGGAPGAGVQNGMQMQPGQGPRTPSFGQFTSPAAANMNLPGSPHVGSPAPGQMQAPGMQMQQSQQGTSSSGPSANTSPASNKRRRPSSAIKAEDDGSGAGTPGSGVNGVAGRTAKPPTPRMPKRVKANPS